MLVSEFVKIEDVGTGMAYISAPVHSGEQGPKEMAAKIYGEVAAYLESSRAEIVQERLYGNREVHEDVLSGRTEALGRDRIDDLPAPTYVEGKPISGTGLAGVHIIAAVHGGAAQCEVSNLECKGRICGRLLRRFDTEFFFLGDIGRSLGVSPDLPRGDQAREIIQGTEDLLKSHDLQFNNVIRTWFYLDDILDWYSEFNNERNKIYARANLFGRGDDNLLPASTGIEGKSPTGLACTLDLIAVRAQDEEYPEICRLSNPRQNEAFDYGSAFSRGAYLREKGLTHVYISGTAAIDEQGRSLTPDDMDAQVERTLINIRDLLGQVGLSFPHIRHACIFFKPGTDPAAYERVVKRLDVPEFPGVAMIADVCRGDLLFEIDGEAAAMM